MVILYVLNVIIIVQSVQLQKLIVVVAKVLIEILTHLVAHVPMDIMMMDKIKIVQNVIINVLLVRIHQIIA